METKPLRDNRINNRQPQGEAAPDTDTTAPPGAGAPIRPEHASNGWQYGSDGAKVWLQKKYAKGWGTIQAAGSSCAWTILDLGGQTVGEASAASAAAAVVAADAWAVEYFGERR
ncbi:hypothetical protein IU500_18745 [Nocardia terpenica]|uniref:hypothetical protein n=1 Tax=Nocardia terpenica TaxID=455432 RepID=UPI0018935B37|nr:hypothetical protein [Nocardia terpenica]MBF6063526.1 hypothetical protein [Nocardia terpenica]MBF6106082.1 hypothetical protein [Nocardia terpenica]MBF6113333.1 hypothetical protein [Nocardia terpenica]MBF6119823.1 hypothetical protein [Nocardia terpenica]MBF6152234.1 hypothetical protein [Nocardia terpenica]